MINSFNPIQLNISIDIAHMVGRCRAWHTVIDIGQHTQLNDVGHHITSLPMDTKHDGTMLGVASHHWPWTAYRVR